MGKVGTGAAAVALLVLAGWSGELSGRPDGKAMSEKERQALVKQGRELEARVGRLYSEGRARDALALASMVLAIDERLYPEKDYPQGHPDLALSLNNLGFVFDAMGEPAKALPY